MPLDPIGALLHLQARGRRPKRGGPSKQRPPSNASLERDYARRIAALVDAWADHVETAARADLAARTGARGDALADDLAAAWRKVVSASGIESWLRRQARASATQSEDYIERVTGLDIRSAFGGADPFREFVAENVSLVTDLGKKQYAQISDIVAKGAQRGARWEDLADEVEARVGVTRNRARLIARDQVGKLRASVDEVTQTAAGITEYEWETSNDYAVRGRPGGEYEDSKEDHWILRGKRFRWDSPPQIPGTTERAHPGQRPLCRCRARPVIPEYASYQYKRPAEISAQESAAGYPLGGPRAAPAPARPRARPAPAVSVPQDLTQGGGFPLRPASLEYLRAGGAASEALPVTVVIRPDGTTYVRDGRHRISLARERGESFVLGDVIQQGPRGGETVRRGVRIPV